MACANERKLCVGCTIGPIFATMNKAKEPMEIWMASYMFSRLAELMVAHIAADCRVRLISPSSEGCRIAGEAKGVGLYSDHIFFEISGTEDEAEAEKMIAAAKAEAIKALAKDMAVSCGDESILSDSQIERLDKSIFVLSTVCSADADRSMPLSEMTDKLDLLECYPPYVEVSSAQQPDLIEKYLISMKDKSSAWVAEQQVSLTLFDELMKSGELNDEGERLDNYVMMVQADGDNVGRLLGRLSETGNVDLIQRVSEFLFECGCRHAETVRSYGALPIYFGGDDMLFLAPVRNAGTREICSVFQLIERLGSSFEKAFDTLLDKEPELRAAADGLEKPALSFGAMMCYCKYPLQLIRETAAEALFGSAKNAEWTKVNGETRSKRAVRIVLRKHSGQMSSVCMKTASQTEAGAYSSFVTLMQSNMSRLSLHALHWKIMEQRPAIAYLLMLAEKEKREERLTAWLQENFNEEKPEEHDLEQICSFLCAVADDLWDGSAVPWKRAEAEKKIMENIDGAFRLVEMTDRNEGRGEER